jgi:hypothetical protein
MLLEKARGELELHKLGCTVEISLCGYELRKLTLTTRPSNHNSHAGLRQILPRFFKFIFIQRFTPQLLCKLLKISVNNGDYLHFQSSFLELGSRVNDNCGGFGEF